MDFDLERARKRKKFLEEEIKKYKASIENTQRFLIAAEDELDDLVSAMIEAEEKQKKEQMRAQTEKPKYPKSLFDALFDSANMLDSKKEAHDAFASLGEKFFGKPGLKKRMEFGVIGDGNGGVVYTYGKESPVIDTIVKMLSEKLPDEVF